MTVTTVVQAAGYLLILLGSVALAMFPTRFPLISNLGDLSKVVARLGPFDGSQIWRGSWGLIIVGTLMQLPVVFTDGGRLSSYDDCILRYVKGGMDQLAVRALAGSCREKFPGAPTASQQSSDRPLTESELALVTGRAGFFSPSFSGTLYNGNANLTVTEVQIVVTTMGGKGPPVQVGQEVPHTSRTYRHSISIPANTAARFSFEIVADDPGASYDWSMGGARGRPSP